MSKILILIIVYVSFVVFSTDSIFAQKSNDTITLYTDKKAYLLNQLISIYGKAAPNEELDVELSVRVAQGVQTDVAKYLHMTSDSSGSFNATLKLPDSVIHSGQYALKIAGNKHDDLTEKHIMLTSLEDLRSYVVHIFPKQQLSMGIAPNEIVCPRVWILVLKPDGKSPVCLEPPTAVKLVERGWTINKSIPSSDQDQLENKIITPEDNDKLINIKKGESFVVKLGSNYDWRINIDNQTVVDSDYSDIHYSGSQGVYRAHNSGQAILTGIGDPPCLSLDPPCMSPSILFQLNINVK